MTAFYTFFIFSFFYTIKCEELSITVFKKLSEINQQWLQATSFPESAILFQHPPYSYHSRKDSPDHVHISETFGFQNKSSPVWYATSDDDEDHEKCSDDLVQVLYNLGSEWALQMLDSDGKLTSGILRGGLIWAGHYSECNNVYAPLDEEGHGDFHGQYCMTAWSMNVSREYPELPLTVGLCIPDSCSAKDIKTALKNVLHILERLPILKRYSSLLSLENVVCKPKTKTLDVPSIIYLTVVIGFVSFTVVGTIVTLIMNYQSRKEPSVGEASVNEEISHRTVNETVQETNPKISTQDELETSYSNKSSLTSNMEFGIKYRKLESQPEHSVAKRILLCFSAVENGEKILNTHKTQGQLLSIHGIRFLSLSWVILGHTYITSVSIIGNRLDVLKEMDSVSFQMLLQSPFSVDSFFILSGFLLTYLFLKEAAKRNGKINWLYFYIHRLWRLTPAYMVIVFFYILIFKYLGSGPFWDDTHCDANRNSWWKYLLYINNFIPIHQMCVGWSWYLANDMQFYLISPLFLYPLWRWPLIGFSILLSMLATTWTITGVLSYKYDLIPMFVGVTQAQDLMAYEEKMWNSFDLIYDKPYCRIAPYIIGVILGFVIHRVNQRQNFLTWWQQIIGWCVAAFCSLSVVFGLYHVQMSRTTALFYNTFCRSSFSVGLAWLIFVCETGHGGFLTTLLSWKLWIPLSRLTYCAYLVHPILIHYYYQAYQSALIFTEYMAVTNFFGFLLMSYGLAFLFSLTFESPLMNLEKMVLKRKSR